MLQEDTDRALGHAYLRTIPLFVLLLVVVLVGSCQPEPAASQPNYPFPNMDEQWIPPWIPEVVPSPDNENCVEYRNFLQVTVGPSTTYEEFLFDGHAVTLKITREDGDEPDTIEVWSVPVDVVFEPPYLALEEYETGEICFKWSDTS